jgi:hypothetical protein
VPMVELWKGNDIVALLIFAGNKTMKK